jgi:alkaline phosphatase D
MEENNSNNRQPHDTSTNSILDKKMNRRRFLRNAGIAAGVLAGAGLIAGSIPFIRSLKQDASAGSGPSDVPAADDKPPAVSAAYPFKLGIASGDPLPDGVVLWTRLVSSPQISGGGMETRPYTVQWEVAKDEAFRQIVKSGTETAVPEFAYSVHAEVSGLAPDTRYYYRFKLDAEISPIGRTKTAPAADASPESLKFAFASCQHFSNGYYTAYEHMVKEEIDVLFFLGDYIYEAASKDGVKGRAHYPDKSVSTLNEYRLRYGQYKSDPLLQAAHAAFPWIVAPDDHEVRNDWAGDGPPYDNNKEFLARRAAAYQAYYEHMPLRKAALPKGPEMLLYRRFKYGKLAEFSVLDTRQFRSEYVCGGNVRSACGERMDEDRTMLGLEQEKWLFDGLKASSAQWNVIPQQIMIAQRDREKGPGVGYQTDKWDGYTATRDRLFKVVKENRIQNFIVLSGDQHNNWVNELMEDFNDAKSPILGTEFLGTSITSGGNGSDMNDEGRTALAENTHIKFYNNQRGYVVCQVTPKQWRTDFRVLQ